MRRQALKPPSRAGSWLISVAMGIAIPAMGRSLPALAQTATPSTPAGTPMAYWSTEGAPGQQIQGLLWGVTWLSIVVVVFIALAVLLGVIIRGRRGREPATTPIGRSRTGVWWIYIGVGVSTVVLIVYAGWTVATMAGISEPPAKPGLTIDVTAHQWWWEFHYENPDSSKIFTTANEIHIPVGVPVRFNIRSADVIHSFWVPALGGKTDAIPGRTNKTWLEAGKPGIYRGQCSEYCGVEHAQMGLRVIADTPADYTAWVNDQLADAPEPTTDLTRIGQQRFQRHCAACHTIRGTPAGGAVGPDLTHLMSRTTIAAGILTNTPANLGGWIANPQSIKPGSMMPNVELTGPELQAIETYLRTLT